MLSSSDVTDGELTVVTGAESLLNSRPLNYPSANIEDDVPLTPNSFFAWANCWAVCTRESRIYEIQPTGERAQGPRTDLSSVVQVFEGVLGYAEYSSKVDRRRQDLKKGDIVLILRPKLPRGKWPLGRVVDKYPGIDGHSQIVKIQCEEKTFVRQIHSLVLPL